MFFFLTYIDKIENNSCYSIIILYIFGICVPRPFWICTILIVRVDTLNGGTQLHVSSTTLRKKIDIPRVGIECVTTLTLVIRQNAALIFVILHAIFQKKSKKLSVLTLSPLFYQLYYTGYSDVKNNQQ